MELFTFKGIILLNNKINLEKEITLTNDIKITLITLENRDYGQMTCNG
jgi:hypothetical protein